MKRIVIQGIKGSFHDIAAHKYFENEDIEIVACDSFPKVFNKLKNDNSALGLVAIENTIAGSLLQNYNLLNNSGLRIIGEHKLRIKHNLVAKAGQKLSDITEVYSHPIALMQCGEFLDDHSNLKAIEYNDTASSAKMIAETDSLGKAAICGEEAANLYGLEILERGIETNKHNFTRFLLLSDTWLAEEMTKGKNINKATLVFVLPHEEGSLAQILSVLSYYKINLTKIQSMPIIGREWEYQFYVDLKFESYLRYKQALDAVTPLTKELRILGEYEEGKQTV